MGDLSRNLGNADWLDGAFGAGDLVMVTVLRSAQSSGLVDEYPNLPAYVARAGARRPISGSFAAQLSVFTSSAAR